MNRLPRRALLNLAADTLAEIRSWECSDCGTMLSENEKRLCGSCRMDRDDFHYDPFEDEDCFDDKNALAALDDEQYHLSFEEMWGY